MRNFLIIGKLSSNIWLEKKKIGFSHLILIEQKIFKAWYNLLISIYDWLEYVEIKSSRKVCVHVIFYIFKIIDNFKDFFHWNSRSCQFLFYG